MFVLETSNGLNFLDLIKYPKIQIKEEAFTFITGKSGCGKSTYLRMLNGTVLPKDGEIIYRGDKVTELDKIEFRRKVMLVPQEVFLFEGTILENFNFYYKSREQEPLDEKQIKNFLHICCADFSLDTQCSSLSGGEKQRVFLSIFISFLPDVLLLDEPTSALDGETSNNFMLNIKEFCKKNHISIVCICHNNELVNKFADEVIRL